jgi:RNA polymerase sigma factor (sigma-70 family)
MLQRTEDTGVDGQPRYSRSQTIERRRQATGRGAERTPVDTYDPDREAGTDQAPEPGDSKVPTWDEVIAGQAGFVYSLAFRLTGNPDDAADLAQDVLIKVRAALPRYRPGSLRGWLVRITTNLFYDRARRLARHPLESLEAAWGTATGEPAAEARLANPTAPTSPTSPPSPEEAALASELHDVVEAALLRLPRDFRVAVVLCDLYGLRYEEISDVMGWRLGTVRSRIHRGRALLRTMLGGYVGVRDA